MDRSRAVIMTLAGLLLLLSMLLVRPFLEFFLLAVLLAYPLGPLQKRLAVHTGPHFAAASLVVGATIAIILPVLVLVRIVVREGTTFLERVRDGDITFAALERQIEGLTGREVDLLHRAQQALEESGLGTVDGVLGVFGTLTSLLVGLGLTMFLLYYFLKDADRFNQWLRATVPLPEHIYDDLRREFDDVMWAVLASHVLIAVVQGIVAGVGLFVLGIPNTIFWTAVMVFLAVLPIIGSFLVWGPAALYLFSISEPLAGGVLLLYGAVVVSFCDDFLRPIIIDRYTETRLNPSAIIIGVLGGVYLLGFIGIFFGPVIIGSLRAVLDIYRREYVTDEKTGTGTEKLLERADVDGDEKPVTAEAVGSANEAGKGESGQPIERETGNDTQPDPQA